MPVEFFVDWPLWEKMVFVLAGAIMLTFLFGFGKLWWMSRRIKKWAIVDEEKRAEAQKLRSSNFTVNSKAETDSLFGVRALESGVEVDGIWVSRSNTPIPETLKSFRNSDLSAESSARSSFSGSDQSSSPVEGSPPRGSCIGLPPPIFRQSRLSTDGVKSGEAFPVMSQKVSSRHRDSAYKPRRSSQLRFSSYGDIHMNKESLSRLEGVTQPSGGARIRCESGSSTLVVEDPSSETAAEIERSFGTESEGSVSEKELYGRSLQTDGIPPTKAVQVGNIKGKGRKLSDQADTDASTGKGTGSCTCLSSTQQPRHSPITPEVPPILASVAIRTTDRLPTSEIEALGESQWPLLSRKKEKSIEHPIFTPGTLHINTAVRRVNSGFEVLPAGTFDMPNSSKKGPDGGVQPSLPEGSDEKRRSKKLQKKGRESMSGKGPLD